MKFIKVTEEIAKQISLKTKKPVDKDEIFCFEFVVADTSVNKDNTRFSLKSLYQLADLCIGKNYIATDFIESLLVNPCLEIFECEITQGQKLKVKAFILKNNVLNFTKQYLASKHKCNINFLAGFRQCSICGEDYTECKHKKSKRYGFKKCHIILNDIISVYNLKNNKEDV